MILVLLALGVCRVLQWVKEGIPWSLSAAVKGTLCLVLALGGTFLLHPGPWRSTLVLALGVGGLALLFNELRRLLSALGDFLRVQMLRYQTPERRNPRFRG